MGSKNEQNQTAWTSLNCSKNEQEFLIVKQNLHCNFAIDRYRSLFWNECRLKAIYTHICQRYLG